MDEKTKENAGKFLVDLLNSIMDGMIKSELETPEGCKNIAELFMITLAGFCESVLNDEKASALNHSQAKAISQMSLSILQANKIFAIVDKE